MKNKKLEKKDYGKEFEEEVRTFLKEKLCFSDVKGGANFHIASSGEKNQIDACGRYRDALFIFECKASGKKIKKNLRQDILATRERARIALKNYKNIPEYSECKIVKFIFITKKIEIPESEKNLFKDSNIRPRVWYADEQMLEYYIDLYGQIGEYAIYNFLSDYGILPPEYEQLKVIAMKTKIGRYEAYSFYVKPKELLKFSYVARRRSLKENFYQRMLEKSRIKKIQQFLDNGGIFPTNIIISLKTGDKIVKRTFEKIDILEENKTLEIGVLTIKNSYCACWIIDGQHRLYSFARSVSNNLIPCIAFDKIGIEDERRFFLEINREQKPIQPDLIWDLEGLANPDTPRGIISNIVRALNKREPFLDKIYIPVKGSKFGKLVNMAAFCNGINNAQLTKRITPNCIGMENPLFDDITSKINNRIATTLEKYFTLIEEDLKNDYKSFVFGNAGVPIMLYLLEPIISYIKHIPNQSELKKYTVIITNFFEENYSTQENLQKLREETTSEGVRKSVAKQIGIYMRKELKDKNFWPKMEQIEFISEIINMERRIASLISVALAEIATNWEKQRVPFNIYQIAKKRMEKDETRFDENLDLSDELQVITQKDNWEQVFKIIFINNKDGFKTQEELKLAFSYLSSVRNPGSHGKSVVLKREDLNLCKIYLHKFSRIVPEIMLEDTIFLED
jgi:DGQHR domain-containing protein